MSPGAGALTCVARQLAAHAHVALPRFQVVDGADVVQAPAGHVVARGSVGTGHHPGGPQGDGVHLQRHTAGSEHTPGPPPAPALGFTAHHTQPTAFHTPTAPGVTDTSSVCRVDLQIFSTLFRSTAIVNLNIYNPRLF